MGRKSRARAQAEMSIGKFELREFMRQEALFNERLYDDEPCLCCVLQSIQEQKQDRIIPTLNKSVNNDGTAADVRSVEESEASISSKNDEEKALKRKLKKERQKEKRNCAKQIMDGPRDKKIKNNSDENNCDPCEPEIPTIKTTITIATDINEQKPEPPAANNNDDDNSESENNDDNETGNSDDIDFSIDAPVVPAFVQSMIHTKGNTLRFVKKINDNNKIKDTNIMSDQTGIADDGFTNVKKGTKQAPAKFNKTPEGFAIEALKMVRFNNFPLAINYLSRAINLDSMDTRHYINRSYCYLRLGRYADALADIKFASEHLTNVTDLAKAKCREGQAFCGLQNYEAAEVAFRHCLKLTPDCPYVKRELKRMQVCQMVSMGFRERKAILALRENSNTTDAIISLSSKVTTNEGPYDSEESATDDEIYESDEEEPSNESLLSMILNYDPNVLEELRATETITPKISRPRQNSSKSESTERELRVIKTINPVVKPDPTVNEMAIWVGNVTPFVTENMLTKAFARFGKVTSVWRAPTGTYCFINFQTAAGAKKALEEASISGGNINVNGHLLLLKHATPKSLKNCH